MRVAFLASDKEHEPILAEAFMEGLRQHGDEGTIIRLRENLGVGDYDIACMVGVKSRRLFHAHIRAGVRVIYFDKGYLRHRRPGIRAWEYWRTAVDCHTPVQWIGSAKMPTDRMKAQGLGYKPWRRSGETVIFAGSSEKYHDFHGLIEPTLYAQRMIRKIRGLTSAPIVYRPKPSWKDAVPLPGARYSRHPELLDQLLQNARVLVTHGSNACFDAVCAGVPCIVLGQGAARPISSTEIKDIAKPRFASKVERRQWLANLAYCQWTMAEMARGEAWATLRPQIFG